ncbi:hypothetical protein QGX17_gp057 [Pseudomonas phage phiPsa381]|uniref:Uncharacterized protein n=2 Tax=Otagovirus TaxID=2560197 RepID=A0A7G9V363_9CAUD|nr:hypothetical protein QGX17_gp057 [Pseudomonas phage phiPsa381]QNO00719.1 hypothetical protein phiPsa381_167 [Pseudomonas phage phiPsa381]
MLAYPCVLIGKESTEGLDTLQALKLNLLAIEPFVKAFDCPA